MKMIFPEKDKKKIKEIVLRHAVDKNKIEKLSDDYKQRYNKVSRSEITLVGFAKGALRTVENPSNRQSKLSFTQFPNKIDLYLGPV